MKTKATKLLALLLAGLMLTATLAACGEPDEGTVDTAAGTNGTVAEESQTVNEAQSALDAIGAIDYGGGTLGVLYCGAFKNEVYATSEFEGGDDGNSQVINEAVYKRNTLLEETCKLTLEFVEKDAAAMGSAVGNEAKAPTGDFHFIDAYYGDAATSYAPTNYLYDLLDLGVELEGSWWDSGTADFVLAGGVYFMSGSLNFVDDNVTYCLIFNKEMQKTYANSVPNPYETVRNWEWTLAHFNEIIQGISVDNGDGTWDEKDTYGFINTWEYGNTLFIGSGLRYVLNDDTVDEPALYLSNSSHMEKALDVLQLSRDIYHDNNASFMSPPGQENLGVTAFKEGRGMFYGEIVSYLSTLNREMVGDYGVLPVPKYDKAQEFYRTWSHDSGSCFAVTSAISESEKAIIGDIFEAYCILSHMHVKPVYYDTVVTSRDIRDAESAEMLDIIFQNRVCDMAFYFKDLGYYELFKKSVNDDSDAFSSSYSAAAKTFDKRMDKLLKKLESSKK